MTSARADTGPLALRLVVGLAFLLHSIDKLGGLDGSLEIPSGTRGWL